MILLIDHEGEARANRYLIPYFMSKPYQIKGDKCIIEVVDNPCGIAYRANHPYSAKLLSGEWPTETELICACDNGTFGGGNHTFGGSVGPVIDGTREVVVYVD